MFNRKLKEEKRVLEAKVNVLTMDLGHHKALLEKSERAHEASLLQLETHKNLNNDKSREINRLKALVDDLNEDMTKIEVELDNWKGAAEAREKERVQQMLKVETAEAEIEKMKKSEHETIEERRQVERALETAAKITAAKEEQLDAVRLDRDVLAEQVRDLGKEKAQIAATSFGYEGRLEQVTKELETYKEQNTRLDESLAQAQRIAEGYRQEWEKAKSDITVLEDDRKEAQALADDRTNVLNDYMEENEKLKAELNKRRPNRGSNGRFQPKNQPKK